MSLASCNNKFAVPRPAKAQNPEVNRFFTSKSDEEDKSRERLDREIVDAPKSKGFLVANGQRVHNDQQQFMMAD